MPLVLGSPYNSQHQGQWGQGVGAKWTLASGKTTTGLTDWADLVGYVSRTYVLIINAATNAAVVRIKTHFDPSDSGAIGALAWSDVDYRTQASTAYTTGATGVSLAGGASTVVYLPPADRMRYVACDITTANANGTSIYLFAER